MSNIERIEAAIDFKPPETALENRWIYWLLPVCSALVVFGGVLSLVPGRATPMAIFNVAQSIFFTFFAAIFIGQGLHVGAYGRVGDGVRRAGRRFRLVGVFALLAIFPFWSAAFGGSLAEPGRYAWMSGALVGGGVGLGMVVLVAAFLFYRYRKRTG